MKNFFIIILIMILFFSLGFIIADYYGYMEPEKVRSWLDDFLSYGKPILAAVIILMLVVDLLLPIPSSVIMALSGMFLGTWIGGMTSFLGAMLASCSGFWLCRWGGQSTFKKLIGDQNLGRIDRWFEHYGVYAIIISRPIPMLTEILSCMAGLTDLRFRIFLLSSIFGTLPICFIYSYVGSRGDITNPWPAIWIAILIPALGWVITRMIKGK